jgi:hypothetical protein
MIRARPLLLLVAALCGCASKPTQVIVTLDTDAPASQRLEVRVTLAGAGHNDASVAQSWVRGEGRPPFSLPSSFSAIPAAGAARNARVTLWVDATLRSADRPPVEVSVRRAAAFAFQPNVTQYLLIFVPTSCFAAATGCTSPGACTVARRCDEQGLTCGDEGRCVPRDAVLQTSEIDASRPAMDASGSDAVADVIADIAREAAPRCPGATECAGECVDTNDDARHCGGCGRACAAGQACVSATCTACVAPRLMCGAECVNPETSAQHCGACGAACAARPNSDPRCVGRACAISCVEPFLDCDRSDGNGCEVNATNDARHCGACGRACAADCVCSGSSCACPAGRSDCGGPCLPTGAACVVGTGACRRDGQIVCAGSGMTGCSVTAGAPRAEVCNGVDDNCDGAIDEDPACVECLTIPGVNVWPLTLMRGDREFDGHGPDVMISVDWTIAGNQVSANACVTATETQSDWSTGQACRTSTSAAAPTNIDAILDPPFRYNYRDTNHNCEGFTGGTAVTGGVCVGDTSGDDICGSSNTCLSPDCAGCQVSFGCVRVRRRAM